MESVSRSDLVDKSGSFVSILVNGVERLAQLQVEDDEIYLAVAPPQEGEPAGRPFLHRLTEEDIAQIPALDSNANPIISRLELSEDSVPVNPPPQV